MRQDKTKVPAPSETNRKSEHDDKEERLEQGLEDSFPASDPVSVSQPTRTGQPDEHRKNSHNRSRKRE